MAYRASKVAIFIDGCFWHGCPRCYSSPSTNVEYWSCKLTENKLRDDRVNKKLCELGWKVLRFWEHEVEADITRVTKMIIDAISEN